jgi:Trk-type K+ transport system membrane component
MTLFIYLFIHSFIHFGDTGVKLLLFRQELYHLSCTSTLYLSLSFFFLSLSFFFFIFLSCFLPIPALDNDPHTSYGSLVFGISSVATPSGLSVGMGSHTELFLQLAEIVGRYNMARTSS